MSARLPSGPAPVVTIRLPGDVRRILEAEAKANCRTLSREILFRLLSTLPKADERGEA